MLIANTLTVHCEPLPIKRGHIVHDTIRAYRIYADSTATPCKDLYEGFTAVINDGRLRLDNCRR